MNVIDLFRNDLWNGIWQHAKALLKPLITPTVISVVLSSGIMYIAYMISKPLLPPEIFESAGTMKPEEIQDLIITITESLAANKLSVTIKMFGVSILFALVSAWYYNVALIISKRLVEDEGPETQALPINGFGLSFKRMIIYGLIMAVVSTIVSEVNTLLTPYAPGIVFLVFLVIQIILLRFFATRAWIVMGDQSVVDGFKLSWEHITFVRALKLILILLVGGLAITLAIGMVFGMSLFAGKVGVFIFMAVAMIVFYVLSAVVVSGLSAAFYRYVEVEYEESSAPENHIIDLNE